MKNSSEPVAMETVDPSLPLIIELCAGSAMLSSCFQEANFDILPVDHKHNRFTPRVPICELDLSKDCSWTFLHDVLDQFHVVFVHCALPCGTCSRAREIDLAGHHPHPLRSQASPLGLPGLQARDQARVDAANGVYSRTAQFLLHCTQHGVYWAIENPRRSLLWEIPCIVDLSLVGTFVDFDACAWGSQRFVQRTFLSTLPHISQLAATCPGNHRHLPVGRKRNADGSRRYATSAEAAYPRELCLKIVDIVRQSVQPSTFLSSSSPTHADCPRMSLPVNVKGTIAMQKQPRGRAVPPLVSEYKYLSTVALAEAPPLDTKRRLTQPFQHLPVGAKLLTPIANLGKTKKAIGDENVGNQVCQHTFGVFRDPVEFVHESKLVSHPFDMFHALPDSMLKVLFRNLTMQIGDIALRRARTLREWSAFAKDNANLERQLHASMEPGIAAVLKGKRILLMKHIAKQISWPDMSVFDEMVEGFGLVGSQPASGLFATEFRPASISKEELKSCAKFVRPALLGKVRSSEVSDDLRKLYDMTCEEATNKHWMNGPLSVSDVHGMHGDQWVPVRRFGVWQTSGESTKLRPIDDYAENRVNSAFAYLDKLDLRALDQMVWACVAISRCCVAKGEAHFVLSDGTELRGPVSRSLLVNDGWKPVLTVVDLASAYKQLAIHPDCRKLSIIAIKDPNTQDVHCFEGRVLPFGATASVVHFNRVARFIQAVGLHLDVIMSNYFDDYPVVSPVALSKSSMASVMSMLDLLGFAYSKDKLKDFSEQVQVLGVVADVAQVNTLGVRVSNKPSRIKEVSGMIQAVIGNGKLSFTESSKLLGRIQYADSQIMGRTGRLAMCAIRESVKRHENMSALSSEALQSFRVLLDRLSNGVPRIVPCNDWLPPVLVFTDGASEGDLHTVGGVLFDPELDRPEFFSGVLPQALVEDWQESMKHVIGPVELYAVVLARSVWSTALSQRRCVFFIDNSSAMDACIKGTSPSPAFRKLLLEFERLELREPCWPWFTRVPSESNVADGPSRGDFAIVCDVFHGRRVVPSCPLTGAELVEVSGTLPLPP